MQKNNDLAMLRSANVGATTTGVATVAYDVLACLQPAAIQGLVAPWTISFHGSLFLVSLKYRSNDKPGYDFMLSILHILDLPVALDPDLHSRSMCPKCEGFFCLINPSRLVSTPAVSITHSYVFLAVHDTLRISCIFIV